MINLDLHEKENKGPAAIKQNSPIHFEKNYETRISYEAKPRQDENIFNLVSQAENNQVFVQRNLPRLSDKNSYKSQNAGDKQTIVNTDSYPVGKVKTREAVPKDTGKLKPRQDKNYINDNMNKAIFELKPKS